MQPVERSDASSNNSSARFHWLALAVLCVLAFFYGLGKLPFLGPDEPRYAQVAREMYSSGDWITPRLAGITWFEKPALTYWLAALGYTLFGVTEFAARAGVALLASVGVFLLYWFGRRAHSARFGYLSAAALATCVLWPGFARGATFDLPLAVCLELALLSFFLWERAPQKHARLWWLFSTALGLALLAKGLVGIVLPALIIGPYLLLTRRWRVLWQPRLLLGGALLLLATAALWYAPMLWRHGRTFVDEFFIAHHFQRYTSNKFKHPQPFYFFFAVVLAGSFPWLAFLLASLSELRRQWLTDETQRLRLFLWLWVMAPLAFFSFSGSKLPGYILPVFPALALLIGEQLLPNETRRWPHFGTALLLGLLGLTALVLRVTGRRELGLNETELLWVASLLLLLAALYLLLTLWRKTELAIGMLPFGIAALLVLAVHQVFPELAKIESLAPLARQAQQAAQPGEHLLFYINSHHSLDFYAPQLPLRDERSELITAMSPREVAQQTAVHSSLLVLSPQRWANALTESPELTVDVLGKSETRQRCAPGCDWVLLRARTKR